MTVVPLGPVGGDGGAQGAPQQRDRLPAVGPGHPGRRDRGRLLRRAHDAARRPGHARDPLRRADHPGRRVLHAAGERPPRHRPPADPDGPAGLAARGRRQGDAGAGPRPRVPDPPGARAVAPVPAELAERPGLRALTSGRRATVAVAGRRAKSVDRSPAATRNGPMGDVGRNGLRGADRRSRASADCDLDDAFDADDPPPGEGHAAAATCSSIWPTSCAVPGWPSRRSTAGSTDPAQGRVPPRRARSAIIVHHTASGRGGDGRGDVQFLTFDCAVRPMANLYLDRSGRWWVCAAGATNTNGKGGPLGPLPQHSANSRVIGIEAGNDGVGEPWPAVDAGQPTSPAWRRWPTAYRIDAARVYGHHEWAPGRKIDPAGPSRFGTINRHASLGHGPLPGRRRRRRAARADLGDAAAPAPTAGAAADGQRRRRPRRRRRRGRGCDVRRPAERLVVVDRGRGARGPRAHLAGPRGRQRRRRAGPAPRRRARAPRGRGATARPSTAAAGAAAVPRGSPGGPSRPRSWWPGSGRSSRPA